MIDFLIDLGHAPVQKTTSGIWFYSPFRNEKSPSFKVRKGTTGIDIFYDFGDSSHGTMVDLAIRLYNLDKKQLYERLRNGSLFLGQPSIPVLPHIHESDQEKALKVKPLNHPALIQYLTSRKIDPYVAHAYLQEVYYSSNNKTLFAVGFKNDKDGYELRSKYTKRTLGLKSSTMLINHKEDKRMLVFEGAFDFLSYMCLKSSEPFLSDILPIDNYCTLNSTSQVQQFLSDNFYNEFSLHLFLDNDRAGDIATAAMKENHKATVQDCRPFYSHYKDINEWWLAKEET